MREKKNKKRTKTNDATIFMHLVLSCLLSSLSACSFCFPISSIVFVRVSWMIRAPRLPDTGCRGDRVSENVFVLMFPLSLSPRFSQTLKYTLFSLTLFLHRQEEAVFVSMLKVCTCIIHLSSTVPLWTSMWYLFLFYGHLGTFWSYKLWCCHEKFAFLTPFVDIQYAFSMLAVVQTRFHNILDH